MTKRDNKCEHILTVSASLFSRKGYFGTGIAEVVAGCGIPKGSFYYYFPGGKEQLAAEVLRFSFEKMVSGIKTHIFSVSSDPVTVFSAMLDRLCSFFGGGHVYESLVITFMGLESVYISDELAAAAREIYHRWQELYREKLLECGYGETEARSYSLILFTLIHGSLISSWIKQNTDDMKRMKQELPRIISKISPGDS